MMNEAWTATKKYLGWHIGGPDNRLGSQYYLCGYDPRGFLPVSQLYSNWWHYNEDLYGDEA